MIPTNDLIRIIREVTDSTNTPWQVVYAICLTESSRNEFAIRHEAHYRWLHGSDLSPGEVLGQKTSWGLMQIMGAVAREYGYTDQFSGLFDPHENIRYGVKHLLRLKERYGTWPHTIASYNAGSPRTKDGRYENQGYVDKVLARWSEVEDQPPIKATEV